MGPPEAKELYAFLQAIRVNPRDVEVPSVASAEEI